MKKIENLNPETLKKFLDSLVDEIHGIHYVIQPMKAKADKALAAIKKAKEQATARKRQAERKAAELAAARELLAKVKAEEKAKKEAEEKAMAIAKAQADAIAKAKLLVRNS